MEKKNYWQYIRGICVILVILIHTLYITDSNLNNIFNITLRKVINFTVPVFIFMAGYFTNIKDTKSFYNKKIYRLLPALIFWNIIYFIIYILTNDNVSITQLIKWFVLAKYGNQLYYVYVLLQLFLIAPILKKYITKCKNKTTIYFPLIVSLAYSIFLFVLEYSMEIKVPYYQYWFFGWFSYYYLGLIIREIDINKKKAGYITIVSLILSIIEGILIYNNKGLYQLSITQLSIFNCFYSIGICMIIYKNKEQKINAENIILEFGNYSFGIFLSHILFLKVVKRLLNVFNFNYYINITLIFIITLFVTFTINKIYYQYRKEKMSFGKSIRKR